MVRELRVKNRRVQTALSLTFRSRIFFFLAHLSLERQVQELESIDKWLLDLPQSPVKDQLTESIPPYIATAAKPGREGKAEPSPKTDLNVDSKSKDYSSTISSRLSTKSRKEDLAISTKRRKQEGNEPLPPSPELPSFAYLGSYRNSL